MGRGVILFTGIGYGGFSDWQCWVFAARQATMSCGHGTTPVRGEGRGSS